MFFLINIIWYFDDTFFLQWFDNFYLYFELGNQNILKVWGWFQSYPLDILILLIITFQIFNQIKHLRSLFFFRLFFLSNNFCFFLILTQKILSKWISKYNQNSSSAFLVVTLSNIPCEVIHPNCRALRH
jgi:hypothetical protein